MNAWVGAIDHQRALELASGAALGDLDLDEAKALDAHLAGCPSCAAAARELAELAGTLPLAAPARELPAALRGNVLGAISSLASDHGPWDGLLAGAALGDLEADEAESLRIHRLERSGCEQCRTTFGELEATAGWLTLAAAPRTPPASLRSAVLRAIADELRRSPASDAGTPLEPTNVIELRREVARSRRLGFGAVGMAAALALAAGGLLIQNTSTNDSLRATTAQRDAALARLAGTSGAMDVVLAPGHEETQLAAQAIAPGTIAWVVWSPGTSQSWLMATGMPPSQAGTVYQLWVADPAGVHALSTFTCQAAAPCVAAFNVDMSGKTAAMVTVEAAGGSTGTPGPEIVFGKLPTT